MCKTFRETSSGQGCPCPYFVFFEGLCCSLASFSSNAHRTLKGAPLRNLVLMLSIASKGFGELGGSNSGFESLVLSLRFRANLKPMWIQKCLQLEENSKRVTVGDLTGSSPRRTELAELSSGVGGGRLMILSLPRYSSVCLQAEPPAWMRLVSTFNRA